MIFASHGTNSYRGVAVLISSRLDYNVSIRSDSDGHVVNILLDVSGMKRSTLQMSMRLRPTSRDQFSFPLSGAISIVYFNSIVYC